MENGEHDERVNLPSSLLASPTPLLPFISSAGDPPAKMKVIISSPSHHGLATHTEVLSSLNVSLSNPCNVTECSNKGFSNPSKVSEIPAVCPPCGLTNTAAESVRVPASLGLKGKKPVVYRECLKNHAAHMGVHATDGCGEFIPGGDEGTLEALTCAACQCHRNFHRRESEDEKASCSDCSPHVSFMDRRWMDARACPFPSPLPLPSPTFYSAHMSQRANHMDTEDFSSGCPLMSPCSAASFKKRFRTKFTEEQKERMASFAEALGWRMQKNGEDEVEQFCREIGVKRQVFKVWMHNNKLTVGKKVPCLTMEPEKAEI